MHSRIYYIIHVLLSIFWSGNYCKKNTEKYGNWFYLVNDMVIKNDLSFHYFFFSKRSHKHIVYNHHLKVLFLNPQIFYYLINFFHLSFFLILSIRKIISLFCPPVSGFTIVKFAIIISAIQNRIPFLYCKSFYILDIVMKFKI